jgi:Kef-type K+ transport system membrane component KefB
MNNKSQAKRSEVAVIFAIIIGLIIGILIKRVRLGIILGLLLGGTIVFLSWLRTQKKSND